MWNTERLHFVHYQMKLQSPASIRACSTQLKERARSHHKLLKQQLMHHIRNHPTLFFITSSFWFFICVDKSELIYFAWSDKILLWGHNLDIPLPFPENKMFLCCEKLHAVGIALCYARDYELVVPLQYSLHLSSYALTRCLNVKEQGFAILHMKEILICYAYAIKQSMR